MKVDWKDPGDAERLEELIVKEKQAKQRDRFRVVLLAGQGLGDQKECSREQIAAIVGRARQFVDQWVGRSGARWQRRMTRVIRRRKWQRNFIAASRGSDG
jgi:hypothetical protein